MASSEEARFLPKSYQVERPIISIGSFSNISPQIKAKKTNLCLSSLAIVNSMVGGALLVLPKSTQNIGIIPSRDLLTLALCILVLSWLLNSLSGHFLISASDISKKTSYSDLAYFSQGRCSIFIQGFTILASYLPIIIVYFCNSVQLSEIFASSLANILVRSFGIAELDSQYFDWYRIGVIALFILELPLILPKQLVQIKLASVFAFIVTSIFTIFSVSLLISGQSQYSSEDFKNYLFVKPTFQSLASFSAFMTAFGYQPVIFPVYLGLENRTPQRGRHIINISLITMTVLYTVICIVGLACFPNQNLKGNILESISQGVDGWVTLIPNLAYLILMAMHIPILFFMSKETMLIMIDECYRKSVSRQLQFEQGGYSTLKDSQDLLPYLTMNPVIYYLITLFVWFGLATFGYLRVPIDSIVNYIGAFVMSMLGFIIPALYFIYSQKKTQAKVGVWSIRLAWALIVFGVILTFILVASNLIVTF